MKQLIISICAILLSGCDGPVKPTSIKQNELAKQTKLSNDKALSCCNSIHEAAANGIVEGIKAHIDAGTSVNLKDNDGLTPLHFVANIESAKLLITKGADINSKDNFFKFTPLDFLMKDANGEMIEYLIKNGARKSEELISANSKYSE